MYVDRGRGRTSERAFFCYGNGGVDHLLRMSPKQLQPRVAWENVLNCPETFIFISSQRKSWTLFSIFELSRL